MPGIFGLVAVDRNRKVDFEFAASVLFKMEDRLRHNASYTIVRWSDPSGSAFLCRIGPAEVNMSPWCIEYGQEGGMASAFFSGMLHSVPDNSGSCDHEPAKRFLESGVSSIGELRGFFAAVFHSGHSTVIATDRRASIPIYYAQSDGILYFAPEPKALVAVPGLDVALDLEAVASLLTSGHTLGPQCLIRSIRRLGGGQALNVSNGVVRHESYWEFRPGSGLVNASVQELEEELGRLTEEAVIRNLGDPAKTAIFLSGGADSRAILGGALAAVGGRGKDLRTVTWGSDRGCARTDAGVAARIAEEFQLEHDYLHRDVHQYAGDFRTVNYVLDGQCDLAALHPSEYRLMRGLRRAGFTNTLRGDQLFGQRHKVYSTAEAVSEASIRRIRDIPQISKYVNASIYNDLRDASDQSVDSVAESIRDLEPNNAKDVLYFNHRLQVYMNNSAYVRQIFLDTRNALLDEEILDFLEVVSPELRVNKQLFQNAMRRRYPELWRLPFSKVTNLEDWDAYLVQDTPVREYVLQQLDDSDSEIWNFFDRGALGSLLDSLAAQRSTATSSIPLSGRAFLRKVLYSLSPRIRSAIRRRNEGSYHPSNRAIFRVLVLKNWYDNVLGANQTARENQKNVLRRKLAV